MNFPPLDKLISRFSRFPGIGPKSAGRLVFFLLDAPDAEVDSLLDDIRDFKAQMGHCTTCGCLTYRDECPICSDDGRSKDTVCVVESIKDLLSVERTGQYRGQYQVLGGALAPLDGVGPDDLAFNKLLERIDKDRPIEVIAATNPTLEGDATASYLNNLVRERFPAVKLTRIARGIQSGGELEFADVNTLSRSLLDRRPLE